MRRNRCFAVLAHQGAAATLADFRPRWDLLDADLWLCLPHGDMLAGWERMLIVGESAILGRVVFERFLKTLERLSEVGYASVTLAEYDTVNLGTEMPEAAAGGMTCNQVWAPPHGCTDGDSELLCFSPWTFDPAVIPAFIEAARRNMERDPDCKARHGILDRWIGMVVEEAGIESWAIGNGHPWPKHAGAVEAIRRMNLEWIHGWKRREDFGAAWPENFQH